MQITIGLSKFKPMPRIWHVKFERLACSTTLDQKMITIIFLVSRWKYQQLLRQVMIYVVGYMQGKNLIS